MLTDKRIEEAKSNFKQYHSDELIKKKSVSMEIIQILKQNANDSLILAKDIYENNKSN